MTRYSGRYFVQISAVKFEAKMDFVLSRSSRILISDELSKRLTHGQSTTVYSTLSISSG
jgi:hypothetical protein